MKGCGARAIHGLATDHPCASCRLRRSGPPRLRKSVAQLADQERAEAGEPTDVRGRTARLGRARRPGLNRPPEHQRRCKPADDKFAHVVANGATITLT